MCVLFLSICGYVRACRCAFCLCAYRGSSSCYCLRGSWSGDVRVLASFTDERIPGFENIPTAKEQGIDVVAVNWRGLYTPKGASDASYAKWTEALRKVGASAERKEAMMANGLAPFNKVGGDFQSYVDGVIGEVRAMSVELGVMK